MPAGLPTPAEDREVSQHLVAASADPNRAQGGVATHLPTITALTNRYDRLQSLPAASHGHLDPADCDLSEGAPEPRGTARPVLDQWSGGRRRE